MARKATNKGTCQGCGGVQKLPNGRLSQHGYTVDYGFFNGTCTGAGEPPYEKSCEWVKRTIEMVGNQITTLEKVIKENTDKATPNDVWVRHRTQKWGNYFDVKAKLIKADFKYSYVLLNDKEETIHESYCGGNKYDLKQLAKALNNRYAGKVKGEVDQLKHYQTNQQRRVDTWKLKDLLPLDDA